MISHAMPGVYLDPSQPPPVSEGGQRKALFLDRDGVINVNHGYVHTAAKTDWVEGIFELCKAARQAAYTLVVVTNQAGIARGYYSKEEFLEYTRWMHAEFAARGAPLAATYYCPHHPQGMLEQYRMECTCRKPGPAMILAAANALDINLAESLLVGDKPSDMVAAKAAGMGYALLLSAYHERGDKGVATQVSSLRKARQILSGHGYLPPDPHRA